MSVDLIGENNMCHLTLAASRVTFVSLALKVDLEAVFGSVKNFDKVPETGSK